MSSHVAEMGGALTTAIGRAPDAVLVHFGVWDLASKWQNAGFAEERWWDGYPAAWVADCVAALRRMRAALPGSRIVFRVIGPTVSSRFVNAVMQQRLDMRFVQALAAASRQVCAASGVPCVDFFGMMLGMEAGCLDGLHWDGGLMAAGVLNLVLNAVCPSAAQA